MSESGREATQPDSSILSGVFSMSMCRRDGNRLTASTARNCVEQVQHNTPRDVPVNRCQRSRTMAGGPPKVTVPPDLRGRVVWNLTCCRQTMAVAPRRAVLPFDDLSSGEAVDQLPTKNAEILAARSPRRPSRKRRARVLRFLNDLLSPFLTRGRASCFFSKSGRSAAW